MVSVAVELTCVGSLGSLACAFTVCGAAAELWAPYGHATVRDGCSYSAVLAGFAVVSTRPSRSVLLTRQW